LELQPWLSERFSNFPETTDKIEKGFFLADNAIYRQFRSKSQPNKHASELKKTRARNELNRAYTVYSMTELSHISLYVTIIWL
jgi:hypothetical protein